MTRKVKSDCRVQELHLDPDCPFVSIKSAESDGVGTDVALEHFEECERCRSYHWMKAKKVGPSLPLLVQQETDRLRAIADEEAKRKSKARRLAKARLSILLAYIDDGSAQIRVEQEGIDQFSFFAETKLVINDMCVQVRASSNQEGYQFKLDGWPHWNSTSYTRVELIRQVSEALAKCQVEKERGR